MQMNLEGLKKSPQKPEDWDLNPGDFQNLCQTKKGDYFCLGILSYYSFGNKKIWWLNRETERVGRRVKISTLQSGYF